MESQTGGVTLLLTDSTLQLVSFHQNITLLTVELEVDDLQLRLIGLAGSAFAFPSKLGGR